MYKNSNENIVSGKVENEIIDAAASINCNYETFLIGKIVKVN